METCLGGRRNKQKQSQKDQKQKSHQQTPEHHHIQQPQIQPPHKQLQSLQLHPSQSHHHHHYRYPVHQQQLQPPHYHKQPELLHHSPNLHHPPKSSMQQERFDPGSVAMYPGPSGGHFGGPQSRHHQDNFSPTSAHLFPNFPPPPDYPPPTMQTAAGMGAQQPKFTVKSSDGVGQHSGANIDDDSGGIGGDIADDVHNRRITASHGLQYRYPDDLDTIEVCLEQEPATTSIQPGIISPVATTGRSFGIVRSQGSAGGGGNNCSIRSNSSQTNNTPTMSTTSTVGMSQIKWTGNRDNFSQNPGHKSDIKAIHPPQHIQQDYSYAYYEPGAAMRHSNIPPPEQAPVTRPPPPNSIRALLSKGKRNKLLVSSTTRQSYQTRYTTQENFYEEIANDDRVALLMSTGHSLVSINQNMVEEEFRRVQNHHRKILGELNLSVEAMLMPDSSSSGSPTEEDEDPKSKSSDNLTDLINIVGPTDELLSPVSSTNPAFCGDLDSGFSGSSGASYIGSLRYHKTNAALTNLLTRKGKNAATTSSGVSGSAAGVGASSFCSGSGSCRSSQRSFHDDSGQSSGSGTGRSSYNVQASSSKDNKSIKEKLEALANAQSQPVQTESKARSFWNKKGWKKTPTSASTSSVNQAGKG